MLIALVVLAVVGGLVDRTGRPVVAAPTSTIASLPTAAPTSAPSSSWYCPGGQGPPGAITGGQVVMANAGPRPVAGTITMVGVKGPTHPVPVSVPAHSQLVVNEAQPAGSSVAATVQLRGGGVGIEQVLSGPMGTSTSPCASATSPQWYLAAGYTMKGDSLSLSLFNPTTSYAVADLSFATDQGPAAPGDFQGIEVPAGSLVVIDVGAHVQGRTDVATTVSARIGRLVVDQLEVSSGAAPAGSGASAAGIGQPGLALSLGAAVPSLRWSFPAGQDGGGITEAYHVYNPSARTAQVSLAVGLDAGSAQPFSLSVGPRQALTLVANRQLRIPQKVGHDAVVTSTNGVPVVALRSVKASSPSPVTGQAEVLGSPQADRAWLVPSAAATSSTALDVVVQDPGPDPASVSVSSLHGGAQTPVLGLTNLVVAPGGRAVVQIGDHLMSPSLALVVTASVPVVVESDQSALRSPGISANLGVPLR